MNQRIVRIFIALLPLMTFLEGHTKQDTINTAHKRMFPTQDSTFSFSVTERHLGIYDNLHQQEVLSKEQITGINITPISSFKVYVDVLIESGLGKLEVKETYVLSRDSNTFFLLDQVDSKKKHTGYDHAGYYYENSIRLANNDVVVHNLSEISPSSSQDGLPVFQKSGVFSLKENRFVIPPEHVRIDVIHSPEYEKEGPHFFRTLVIVEDEFIHQMEYYDEEGYLYGLPLENFRHGLYSSDFQLLIKPTDAKIESMHFGGFHRGKVDLYDRSGRHIPTNYINTSGCEDVFVSEHFIIVQQGVDEEDHSNEKIYSFYDNDGRLIESRTLEVSNFLSIPQKALALVSSHNEDFEYITYQGIFDFDKRALVVPSIYNEIKVEDGNLVGYYFSCRKADSLVYYNKDFKIFEPSK